MYASVALEGRQIKFHYFKLLIDNWLSWQWKGYFLIGLNENKSIHINFKEIMTFQDDLVSNLSLQH